jgi:hypothetical protein
MVAVAIVGVILYGELTRRRWAKLSAAYRSKAELARVIRDWSMGWAEGPMQGDLGAGQRESLMRRIAYQAKLAEKYEHAARYPWLPVAPDPPEPE